MPGGLRVFTVRILFEIGPMTKSNIQKRAPLDHCRHDVRRSGNVLVLAAGTLVLVFAFTAFTVDIGYITTTKGEMHRASDAAALAATLELADAYGPGKLFTMEQAATRARAASHDVGEENRSGGRWSTYVDGARDVRFGQYNYDAASGSWVKSWGVAPYNLVEVTVRRDQAGSVSGDSPLDLFFAPVIGTKQANVVVTSTAALRPGVGFRKIPGQNIGILPITLDEFTWEALMAEDYVNANATDNYTYHDNGNVSGGSDGIFEVNLYPQGSILMPPGNRGTLDIGSTDNSTDDITRQILHGLNDEDWAALLADQGISELHWDGMEVDIQGDTGISAGIKDELEAIKGVPKAIPIFRRVSGPGNNAIYTIIKFVGIRVMSVRLEGFMKHVMIQPAPYFDGAVVWGETELTEDSILSPGALVP
jgi:Flp pilus assembly protein TadG